MKSFPNSRSAKAVRKTRRANLNLMPNWADVELEKKALLAVVTWDGGAGTMNWGDAANWDGDSLPGSSDDVVIPDLAGTQTVIVNTSPTILSVNSAEGLTISSGQWLTINGGNSSQVDGLFTVQGGFVASNANTTFLALNTANIQNAYVSSQESADVVLGGLTEAYNSVLITNYGGKLALPDLIQTSYTSVGANWNGDNTGRSSLIEVPKLETGHYWSNFRALDGGVINSPGLKNIDYSYIWIRGANSTMNLQGVTSLNNTQITLDNQNTISSLPVTSMTNWSWIGSDGTSNVSLPLLTSLSYSSLHARYGGVLTASALTDVTNGYFGANWDGDGYGRQSVLNLPLLQSGGGSTQYRAMDGGVISSPKLDNLEGDNVWIRGANSTMDLSNVTSLNSSYVNLESANAITSLSISNMTSSTLYLQSSPITTLPLTSMTNWSWIGIDGTSNVSLPALTSLSYSSLHARYGGVLTASALTDVTNGYFGANWDGDGDGRQSVLNLPLLQSGGGSTQYRAMDGGVISIPKLDNLDGDNVWIRGANSTMDLSNVTALNSSYVNLESANAITSLSISNMTGSTLNLQSSPITTLPLNVMQGSTIYSWYTTNVTLPSLTTASDSGFRADYGGTMTLSVLTNMTNGGFGANWDGDYWYQRVSVLNLPELQKTAGGTTYRALDGGVISSPKLNNLDNDNVYIRGANSTMDLSNVTALNSSYVNLESANSITSLSISNMTGSTLYLLGSPVTTLPLNVMQSSTIYSWYTTNVTLPSLTTASDSGFRADYGGTLTLPVLTNMTNGGFGANWDGAYWYQRVSVLNLPELQKTTGYTQYRVQDGGVISSPKLNNLDSDNVYIRGANSTMDLSNVTTLNNSYVNLESADSISSLSISNMTSSTIIASYTTNVTLPSLANAIDSNFRADYGATLNLPELKSVNGGSFSVNRDGDWYQRPSKLALSKYVGNTNSTSFTARDSGVIIVDTNTFNLSGSGSSLWLNNGGTIFGNITLRDGAVIYSYWGDATINGNLVNDGGVITPNYYGSSGKLTVTGDYTQTSAGMLNVDLNGTTAGTGYDQLIVGGTATLAGRLNVSAGFTPSVGDSFEIVKAVTVVNDFELKIMPTLYGVRLVESAGAQSVKIDAITSPVLSVADTYNDEGDTNWGNSMAFVVSGTAPAGGITVNYNTIGGNPGVDYVAKSGSFTVSAGQYSQTVYVTIIGNQQIQGNRLFQLQASTSGYAPGVGTGMINDDDAPTSVSFNTSVLVASPNTGFSPSPTLTVRNRYGNYVQGASVSLLVGSSIAGASASFSNGTNSSAVTTDSNGTASVPGLTANAKFGSYRLTANALALNGSATATGNMTLVNAGNTGLSWDGGAGTNNWDDELNWNEDRLPMSFDDVVVGDLPGSQTIVINSSPVIKSLQSAESIRLATSQTLQLTAGNSSINGSLVLPNGSSLSANGSASLVVDGGSELTSGCLTATSGASIVINGVTTAINPGLYASGGNSTISLNGLESIQSNYYLTYSYPSVEAQYGGAIYLPNLTTTSRVGTGYSQGQIYVYGQQSQVSMPKLNQFDGFETISVSGGANFTLPMVTTAKNLYLYSSDTDTQISLPNLTTIYSNSIVGGRGRTEFTVYSNALISLPCLTTIALQDPGAYAGSITINYQGSRLIAPNLRYISAISTINAYSDVTFETSGNLSNNGNLTVYSPGNLSVGNLHFSNTNVVMSSSPRFSGNLFVDSGANIFGAASVYGNLTVVGGTLRLSSDSPTVFNVYGDYSQTNAGTLEVRIGGCNTTTYNQLVVSGTANLSGTLTGGFTGTDVPTVGKTYEIIKAGSIQNDFSSVSLDQYGWIGLTKTNTSNSVKLTTITSNTPPSLWTMNSPAGGPLPAGVTLVGGLVLDMVGVNGVRVVSQLSANSLYIGFYDSGDPTSYRGNPGTIGIQTGITANAVNALGGGLKQVAVRMTLWDGDTGLGDFDRNDNTIYLNGVLMGNYSNVTTQQTSTNGLIVYSNNTNGGFRNDTLDTGFFFSNSSSFLTSFFSTLSTGNVTFTSYDTDPYDNYYDYTQGIAGGLINVGLDPNVSPSSILLSNNSIAENQPSGTLVGTISAVDANVGDTHTFDLVSGAGSDDNGSFTIIGNKLYSNTIFDYESKNSLTIRIRVTDNGGLSYEQALAIVVTNVNEAPTNVSAGGPYSIYQGQPLTLTANATDPDANTTLSYSWDINNDGTFGDATGQSPSLTWTELNALGISTSGLRNIKVRASDGLGGAADSPIGNLTINQTELHYVSGNQSTMIGTVFAETLKVLATDSNGNPLPNVVVTFNAPSSGATASFSGGVNTATSNSSGVASSATLTANNIGGSYTVTASVAGVASQVFSLANSALSITAFTVQKGSVGRSFVRYVDIGFNSNASLSDIVASIGTANPRIRITNTGLDGTANVNYSLAGKIAAVDAVLAMDFGTQGIGGDRNSAVGDGSYLIEMDLDGNGSFETSRRFFRLLGDVNGDKVVDSLDANIVATNIGATGTNVAADINGDGVVNAADTLLVRRQKGRRITI